MKEHPWAGDRRVQEMATREVGMKGRIAWVHANFDEPRALPSIEAANEFIRSLAPTDGALAVFVNNNQTVNSLEHIARGAGWHYLSGSNAVREFSAWQEGLEYLRSMNRAQCPDVFVFSNDTYLFHQPFRYFLRLLFLRTTLRRVADGGSAWAIGQVERSPTVPNLDRYFSTAFFILDRAALARIGYCLSDPAIESYFDADLPGQFFSRYMDPVYGSFLRSWLFVPSPKSWYRARPLTAENALFMRGKAACILNEHSLSRRLIQNGVEVVSCFEHGLCERPLRVAYRILQAL